MENGSGLSSVAPCLMDEEPSNLGSIIRSCLLDKVNRQITKVKSLLDFIEQKICKVFLLES